MKFRSIANVIIAEDVEMGHLTLKQPLPSQWKDQISPFLLLHHLGPITVEPGVDPLALSPHPHRGFEPVSFVFKGSIEHRDSRGNDGTLTAGDVQWMTAGMGIVHSERTARALVESGGELEIIQLWVNLPIKYKMTQPNYQDIKAAKMPVINADKGKGLINLVAGELSGEKGLATTFTPITAAFVELEAGAETTLNLPKQHNALIYFLEGEGQVNNEKDYNTHYLINFKQDAEAISIKATANTRALLLSGEPINEPVKQYGPFVMTNQTEILEAMRDYQMGKMGMLTY